MNKVTKTAIIMLITWVGYYLVYLWLGFEIAVLLILVDIKVKLYE